MKILIAIPTYRRAGNITTHTLFDEPVLFVDTDELQQYKAEYPKLTIVEHKGEKGLTPKLNTILDYGRKHGYDAVFKVDDDIIAMGYFAEGYTDRTADKQRIYEMIERLAIMARDLGTPLFSVNQVADIRKHKRYQPFDLFYTLKLGAYGLLLDNDLRFDTRFVLKQDIDMCLQVLLHYRMVLADTRYGFYTKATMATTGGCASYRTKDREQQIMKLLKAKWGEQTFSNGRSQRASIYTVNIQNPFK